MAEPKPISKTEVQDFIPKLLDWMGKLPTRDQEILATLLSWHLRGPVFPMPSVTLAADPISVYNRCVQGGGNPVVCFDKAIGSIFQ